MPCPYHASSLTGRDEASRLLSDEATGPDFLFLQPQTLVVGFAPKVLLSVLECQKCILQGFYTNSVPSMGPAVASLWCKVQGLC